MLYLKSTKTKKPDERPAFSQYIQVYNYPFDKAAAPLTISVSSVVIAAWRAWLYESFKAFNNSPAFSVALSIAVILAPCSDALESNTARYN